MSPRTPRTPLKLRSVFLSGVHQHNGDVRTTPAVTLGQPA